MTCKKEILAEKTENSWNGRRKAAGSGKKNLHDMDYTVQEKGDADGKQGYEQTLTKIGKHLKCCSSN